ncbi:MAG: hypothetical protein ABSG68_26855 [Thermoguttaceae bacterium]|jgi:hypothetical protein
MANEIQASLSVRILNGAYSQVISPQPASIAQTNVGAGGIPSQSIPTADTVIAGLTGLTANGYAFLQNLDATHYILWGPDNGSGAIVVLGKLKPGEYAWVRIAPSVVLRAKADTAACKLQVFVLED